MPFTSVKLSFTPSPGSKVKGIICHGTTSQTFCLVYLIISLIILLDCWYFHSGYSSFSDPCWHFKTVLARSSVAALIFSTVSLCSVWTMPLVDY